MTPTDGTSPRVVVVGVGVVGSRVVRQLHATSAQVIAATTRPDDVLGRCGMTPDADVAVVQRHVTPTVDVAVLAGPGRSQVGLARRYLAMGSDVIAVNDDLSSTKGLLALDRLARDKNRTLIVGAGFAPGISCALAGFAASRFTEVGEIHIAKHGTAGPSCARQHHRALRSMASDIRANRILRRPGGSGRELVWFPGPIDGADCYRAELTDPTLLRRAFPRVERATSRVAAHRRDRLTSVLPMLLPPHPEGGVGAIRVEVRGSYANGVPGVAVVGVAARPGDGAGAMAAALVDYLGENPKSRGALGVAELGDSAHLLDRIRRRGVPSLTFEGSALR